MTRSVCRPCTPTVGGRPLVRDGEGMAGVCLQEYQTEVDDSTFTTSNTALTATGKTLVTPVGLVAGIYRFGFSYCMGPVSEFDRFAVNVRLDGGGFIFTPNHEETVQDDDDGERWVYARTVPVVLAAGAHTFEVYLASPSAGIPDPQTIRETTLEIWRVG